MSSKAEKDPILTDLDKAIEAMSNVVSGPDGKIQQLKNSWHYLQVYSTWCERLPNDESELKTTLGITETGVYTFFSSMLDAYQKTSNAGKSFVSEIFPDVVKIGDDLKEFAEQASSKGDAIFSAILELLDQGDMESVIQLISGLQDSSNANALHAETVGKLLADFKSQLDISSNKIDATEKMVQADEATSQKTLDKLNGGPKVDGSISSLRQKIKDYTKEYNHDVVVAATTPTYCWVSLGPIPIGLIAAITVASIYGSKATDMLSKINDLKDELDKDNEDLTRIAAVYSVQNVADHGLGNIGEYTKIAIGYTTTVQNSWNMITTNLDFVKDKLGEMTGETDKGKVAKSKTVIRIWAKQAAKRWDEMYPSVKALVENPYITVQEKPQSADEFAKDVNACLQNAGS